MVVERTATEKVMVERAVSDTGTVSMLKVVEFVMGRVEVEVRW